MPVPYPLWNLEPWGRLFVVPGDPVYEMMIVGDHNRGQDINLNPCNENMLTTHAGSRKRRQVILSPIKSMTLDQASSFFRDDVRIELTPISMHMRKATLSAKKRRILQTGRMNKKKPREPSGPSQDPLVCDHAPPVCPFIPFI